MDTILYLALYVVMSIVMILVLIALLYSIKNMQMLSETIVKKSDAIAAMLIDIKNR